MHPMHVRELVRRQQAGVPGDRVAHVELPASDTAFFTGTKITAVSHVSWVQLNRPSLLLQFGEYHALGQAPLAQKVRGG
jgi:hypothetical protein